MTKGTRLLNRCVEGTFDVKKFYSNFKEMMNKLNIAHESQAKVKNDLLGIAESFYLLADHPDVPNEDVEQGRLRLLTGNMKIGLQLIDQPQKLFYIYGYQLEEA